MNPLPIVVGVNGSKHSFDAVDFAAREAQMRRLRLHIVHIEPVHGGGIGVDASSGNGVQQMLAAATARALHVDSGLSITAEVLAGPVARSLADQSGHASLIVIGRRHGRLAALRASSVAAHLSTRTACPLIVAQGVSEPATNIIAGVDAAAGAESVLEFAFGEAALRETGVTVTHAYQDQISMRSAVAGRLSRDSVLTFERAGQTVLAETLVAVQGMYPQVKTRQRLVDGPTDVALVAGTMAAQLIVIGGPSHDPHHRMPVGSMSHVLLRRAMCPVALVPCPPA
jgi:nucleotide-binding universal stress UspA family protein